MRLLAVRYSGVFLMKTANHNVLTSSFKTIRIHRKEVCYLRHILESYEGVAVLTTLDAERGIVRLCIPPGQEKIVDAILYDLEKQMLIEGL